MGAWGTAAFDNDVAADWAHGLAEGGANHIAAVLTRAAAAGDYLDADAGAEALAAAETVARLRGGSWEESVYAEAVDEWVRRQDGEVTAELVDLARRAIGRVMAERSELRELWEDAGEPALSEWRRTVDELDGRLRG